MRFSKTFSFLALVATAGACFTGSPARAGITYDVTADTSSVVATAGYLDLQFEPSPTSTNFATAVVNDFMSDGVLSGAATITGDVTGQLPGALTFDNATAFNDYFQAMTFGTSFSFDVTLDGPTPLGGAQSALNISFYDSTGSTPILTTDTTDGIAGQILLNPDGTTSTVTIPATAGGVSVLTITPAVETVTPEPSYMGLMGLLGCGAILVLTNNRRGRGCASPRAGGR
jgi:hypothetical protein